MLLTEARKKGLPIYGFDKYYNFIENLTSVDYKYFHPKLSDSDKLKVCYLTDEYEGFEAFIAYKNLPYEWRRIPEPTQSHQERAAFVQKIACAQNEFRGYPAGPGISWIVLDKKMNNALVYYNRECGPSIPTVLEKDDQGRWKIVHLMGNAEE